MMEKLERLAAAHIGLLPAIEITTHFVFERDGFVALVERREDGFGKVGSAGLLAGSVFATLVWRGSEPWFVGKGFERPAVADEVAALRAFQGDLEAALR